MTYLEPTFSFGMEEEYFLVDQHTRALAKDPPRRLIVDLKQQLGKQFSEEYMRSQIEISTPVCHTATEARTALVELRNAIAEMARGHGLAPIAGATHPFSLWRHQRHRDKPRYNDIAEDFQGLGRRMAICGLHVHIGIEDPELRIAIMNALRPFLPLMLALTASSPFWGGEDTGLKSYRTAINDSTPRKGIPERFANWRDFQRTVDLLTGAGIIEDASKIWWDVRPSVRFKTLEVRIIDVCPLVDDAVCVASMLRCLCRCLCRMDTNLKAQQCPLMLINENRWRAQRYGIDEGLIDPLVGAIVPVKDLVEQLLDMIRDDAEYFGCTDEVNHARTIVTRGTSADRQLARYQSLIEHGVSRGTALAGVVDQLIEDTANDLVAMPVADWTRPALTTGVLH